MTNDNDYKNVWGYVRWSTEPQEEGNSEQRQLDSINKAADALGRTPVKVFYDRGISAAEGANLTQGWAQLKAVIGKGDVILVERTDRICRQKLGEFLPVIKEIVKDKGAYIKLTSPSYNGMVLSRDNYDSDWNILVSNKVDSEEQIKRTERTRLGVDTMKKKLRSGKWAKVAKVPWWIISDKEKQCYTVDEEKANVVRDIFAMYNAGISARKIVDKLNKYGKKEWFTSTVWGILTSKAVLGYFNRCEENVSLYPPIITPEVYWSAQEKRRHRRYTGAETDDVKINLLKSLVYCAECGRPMEKIRGRDFRYCLKCNRILTPKKGSPLICKGCGELVSKELGNIKMVRPDYYYYRCSGFSKASNGCKSDAVRIDRLEESLRMLLSKSEIMMKFITTGVTPTPYKLDSLKLQLADARRKEEKLARIITNDDTPSQVLLKSLKEVEAEARKLSVEIDHEEATIRAAAPTLEMVKDAVNSKLLDKWEDADSRLQIRELLRSIIKKVIINKTEKWYEVWFNGEIENPIKVELKTKEYKIDDETFPYETKK